jgi:hypothetical protein
MYLMWKWDSSTPNTIPVALGFVPWNFSVSFIKQNGELVSDPNGKNFFQVGAFNPIQQIDRLDQILPQWTTVALNTDSVIKVCEPPP